ncbi:Protein of unknown function [Cotesia congregata]|uniref:Uncharacterized protein n=1 Tax=Cotesia congregata TaxID=51543 RepID=A0A8J2HD71_COTCN|nr:Protein of unknown function [Cotesia congregata]
MAKINWIVLCVYLLPSQLDAGLTEELVRLAKGPIQEAFESGAANDLKNEDCIWRRGYDTDDCPDPDVHIYLYTPGKPRRELVHGSSDWLRRR